MKTGRRDWSVKERTATWRKVAPLALVTVLMMAVAVPLTWAAVVVTDNSPDGWVPNTADNTGASPAVNGTSGVDFVVGPGTPPLGVGSAHLFTGNGTVGGDESGQLRNTTFSGVKLSDLTSLKYCTFGTKWNGQQLPYLSLQVDTTGTGSDADDQIFFEPAYQTPLTGNPCLPDQGAAMLNTWQCWDVFAGGWWANSGGGPTTGCTPGSTGPLSCPYTTGMPPASGVCSLADYIAQYPNARILNHPGFPAGGVRLNVGFASPGDQFDGNVDKVVIGVSSNETTYDFEPRTPCDSVDPCTSNPSIAPCTGPPGTNCFCAQPAETPTGPGQGSCVDVFFCVDAETCPGGTNEECTNPARPVCYLTACDGQDPMACPAPRCGPTQCVTVTTTTTTTTPTTTTSTTAASTTTTIIGASTTTTVGASTTTTTTPCVPQPENTSTACGNMVDDDCDGLIDCADPDCTGIFPCPRASKDPTIIQFHRTAGGLDMIRGHAKLQMAAVDLTAMPVSVLLSNLSGRIFSDGLPAGALTLSPSGTIYLFRNSNARASGGMYSVKIKKNKDKTSYTFSFTSYGDLSTANASGLSPAQQAQLANMRLQFYIGDDANAARDGRVFITLNTPWTQTSRGWRAPKDH